MPKFKNTRTGRIVDVPDRPETRTNRPKRDRQWSDKINRMDRSKRWERVRAAAKKSTASTEG